MSEDKDKVSVDLPLSQGMPLLADKILPILDVPRSLDDTVKELIAVKEAIDAIGNVEDESGWLARIVEAVGNMEGLLRPLAKVAAPVAAPSRPLAAPVAAPSRPRGRRRRRVVTPSEVEIAILVAQVMATGTEYRLDYDHYRCSSEPHCESCECELDRCSHGSEWECVCAALGGTPRAADLYLAACSEITHWLQPNEHWDCSDSCGDSLFWRTKGASKGRDLQRSSDILWGEKKKGPAPDLQDLEVASLLADGWLPVDWELVRPR